MQAHPKIFGLSLIFLVLTGTLSSYATDFSDCASSARRLRGAAEDAESASQTMSQPNPIGNQRGRVINPHVVLMVMPATTNSPVVNTAIKEVN